MKKICLLILALSMVALPALSEEIDLTTMSLDALQTLHERLDAEITNRTICEDDETYTGLLIGGKNIKIGSYVLQCVSDVDITVCANEDDMKNNITLNNDRYVEGDKVAIYIDNGTVVSIERGIVQIEPATADWTPTESE